MNDIVIPNNFGALPARFAGQAVENDLAAGVSSSFGIVGYRGKVWAIKFRGNETALLREDGDGPRNSIEVVVVKASNHISKIWYENGFVEGSTAAPDCWSTNGVTPDAGASKKQSNACANCPKNAWGSAVSNTGKQAKACKDGKRVVVVPLGDIDNTLYGGPMLLRVPPASLQDLAQYGNKLQQMGYPYQFVGTRISFDPAQAYPKFVFGAIRPLTEAECSMIDAMRNDPQVARILAEGESGGDAPAAPPTAPIMFEQPPLQPAPVAPVAPVAQKVSQPAPAPAAEPKRDYRKTAAKAEPAPTTTGSSVIEQVRAAEAETDVSSTGLDDLDAQLDAMLKT